MTAHTAYYIYRDGKAYDNMFLVSAWTCLSGWHRLIPRAVLSLNSAAVLAE